MELEKQEKQNLFNQIIYWEGQIIGAHNDYMERKNKCESEIKRMYDHIARSKRMEFLKKRGLTWSCPADDILCREESEKELQRWKNLAPGEKIREHREEISKLENEEDWEVNDIQVDRWIEEENEKEIERLEKLTPGQRFSEEVENAKQLQEAEKNNWYCS